LIADGLADALAAFLSYEPGAQAGRQPARFQHHNLTLVQLQQRRWNTRGFSCAGRSFEHQIVGFPQMPHDLGNRRIHRQLHGAAASH